MVTVLSSYEQLGASRCGTQPAESNLRNLTGATHPVESTLWNLNLRNLNLWNLTCGTWTCGI